MSNDRRLRELLTRVSAALEPTTRQTRLLQCIAWPAEVEKKFFASGASKLPVVEYVVDRDGIGARMASLTQLLASIDSDDAIAGWLREVVQSFIDGNRMLLALGTTEFYRLSRELYGGARTRFEGQALRNIDLAEHLSERLKIHGWDEAADAHEAAMTGAEFAEQLRGRVALRRPKLDIEVVMDDNCAAKVQAGRTRVRVRTDGRFMPWEVTALWNHEVETHALTALNGDAQPYASFLRAGGPRSTRTQEGLAIFAELYDHDLSIDRMQRLADRVKLVAMAEDGADFIALYRYLLEHGSDPHEAYLDAQRICRGGRVEGGAPFTKDTCYLAGLLQVYSFLSVVIRGGHRDEAELLVAGRLSLDDMHALVDLRQRGLLERPKFLPTWLARWRGLLPYFAFASFANEVKLPVIEQQFEALIGLAGSHNGPKS